MKVTAVIPCHNHANWLMDAVHSVALQDYPDKRIVVVDDGSTDGSFGVLLTNMENARAAPPGAQPMAVLGTLKGTDVVTLGVSFATAHGPAFARNWGIRAGWEDTDLFALLDSDDQYEQGKLSRSVAVFRQHPDVGAVYSDYDTLRPDGVRLRQYKEPFDLRRLRRECIVNCDSLVAKWALDKAGVFDPELRVAEDYDLWLRVAEHSMIMHLAESLVTIRVGLHSSTTTVPTETWRQCHARVMNKLKERLRGSK